MLKTSKRKTEKLKSKYKYVDDDDEVDAEVEKAMREVEKAMKQVKLAEKAARQAKIDALDTYSGSDISHVHKGGIDIVHSSSKMIRGTGTCIHVAKANNIQIGDQNHMKIYSRGRKKKSRTSSSFSDSSNDELDVMAAARAARADIKVDDKDPSEMTEAEMRIYRILHSERIVAPDDIEVACEHVGNWKRFLRNLGLDEATLDQLQQDYHLEGVRQIIYTGVILWSRRESNRATIGRLAQVLQKVGCLEALEHLQP